LKTLAYFPMEIRDPLGPIGKMIKQAVLSQIMKLMY